jgi:hypothetical protein
MQPKPITNLLTGVLVQHVIHPSIHHSSQKKRASFTFIGQLLGSSSNCFDLFLKEISFIK